jgi:hypothetical protein
MLWRRAGSVEMRGLMTMEFLPLRDWHEHSGLTAAFLKLKRSSELENIANNPVFTDGEAFIVFSPVPFRFG